MDGSLLLDTVQVGRCLASLASHGSLVSLDTVGELLHLGEHLPSLSLALVVDLLELLESLFAHFDGDGGGGLLVGLDEVLLGLLKSRGELIVQLLDGLAVAMERGGNIPPTSPLLD